MKLNRQSKVHKQPFRTTSSKRSNVRSGFMRPSDYLKQDTPFDEDDFWYQEDSVSSDENFSSEPEPDYLARNRQSKMDYRNKDSFYEDIDDHFLDINILETDRSGDIFDEPSVVVPSLPRNKQAESSFDYGLQDKFSKGLNQGRQFLANLTSFFSSKKSGFSHLSEDKLRSFIAYAEEQGDLKTAKRLKRALKRKLFFSQSQAVREMRQMELDASLYFQDIESTMTEEEKKDYYFQVVELKRNRWRTLVAGLFVILWLSFILTLVLNRQASLLQLSYQNAELEHRLDRLTVENTQLREDNLKKLDLRHVGDLARKQGLFQAERSQKIFLPQPMSNQLLINQESANAQQVLSSGFYYGLEQVYSNVESYYRTKRDFSDQDKSNIDLVKKSPYFLEKISAFDAKAASPPIRYLYKIAPFKKPNLGVPDFELATTESNEAQVLETTVEEVNQEATDTTNEASGVSVSDADTANSELVETTTNTTTNNSEDTRSSDETSESKVNTTETIIPAP